MASTTPPGTIIEGLEQGNAVELELLKKMKDGLEAITDEMMRECYNRSDALSELRENLPTINPTINTSLDADQKSAIKDIISSCMHSIDKFKADSARTRDQAVGEIDERHKFKSGVRSGELDKLVEKSRNDKKMGALLEELHDLDDLSSAARSLQKKLADEHDRTWTILLEDWIAHKKSYNADNESLKKREEQVQET